MSWKGILGKAGVALTGPDGANDWTFEGQITARNIISRFAGQHFHVDSGHASATDHAKYGKRKEKPFATLDFAVGQCTVNDGDVIWAHAGHTEAIVAAGGLDLDVEGITIVFLGNGDDQAKITFGTDVDADMDVDADNITLINPRFESDIDALTGPIDINKANFTIINGEYYDAAAKAVTDCVVAGSAATGLTINGWKYFESSTGTQKQSNLQLDGVDNLTLNNIDIRGDFATGNVENVTDELLNVRLSNMYLDNLSSSPTPAMVLDSNCDGMARNVHCRIASGTTYVSDLSDINWGAGCLGYNADGGGGDPIGTAHAGGLEGKIDTVDGIVDNILVDTAVIGALGAGLTDLGGMSTGMKGEVQDECEDALEGEDLDHLMKLDSADQPYPVNCAADSALAKMLCKGDPATPNSYSCVTDSQEMISDKLGGYSGDGGANLDDSVKAALDLIEAQTDDIGTAGASLTDLGGMSTGMKGEVQDECEDALEGEDLDHLMKLDSADQAYPVNCADDSVIAKMLCKGDPATIATYDCQTDSQEMLSDKLGGFSGDGGAADDDSVKASLDLAHTDLDTIITDTGTTIPAAIVALPKCIEKTDGAVLNGLDPLFTITGGLVRCKIVGHVTTLIGGAANLRLQHITTDPAATVELNAGAVAVDADAVGTVYHNLGATSVFTPSTGLGFVLLDPVTVEETEFILAPGVVQCLGSAAQDGVIKWSMSFTPLSPDTVVTVAA